MISVVLDTNVFISAFVFGGNPRRVVQLAEAAAYTLVISQAIQDETERILLQKFHWGRRPMAQACIPVWNLAQVVAPKGVVTAVDDPDDNRILECALDVGATVIVTGDQDLLRLNPYQEVSILPPAEFLRLRMWQQKTRG